MIDVTAAIIQRISKPGLILAARNKPGRHNGGLWEFPGGKIEPGETPQQCLARELHEELGITVVVHEAIAENSHIYTRYDDHISIRLLAYRVEHISGDFNPVDHDQLQWLAPAQLDQLHWAAADIPLVKAWQRHCQTLDFYQQYAASYADETRAMDMNKNRDAFLQQLPVGAHILDLGCGAGRDSKAFIAAGCKVTAIDASSELATLATAHIGQPVEVMPFAALDYQAEFDGIWACASLLHCDKTQLPLVMAKLIAALKPGGVTYLSFKWGEGDNAEYTDAHGRYFNNTTTTGLRNLLAAFDGAVDGISINRLWGETTPLRNGQQRWVNVLFSKELQ